MSKNDSLDSSNDDKSEKALFIQRLLAFMIDSFLVALVASFIVMPFINSKSVTVIQNNLDQVLSAYRNFEISTETFLTESMSLNYQLARESGAVTLVTLFLEVLYFIVYQYNSGGKTLGKKLMKIKVISTDGKMTMNQMLFRSLIINSILADMIIFAFAILSPESVYLYGALVFAFIKDVVLFVSAVMIIFSKNGQGIHDLISHTEVVRES